MKEMCVFLLRALTQYRPQAGTRSAQDMQSQMHRFVFWRSETKLGPWSQSNAQTGFGGGQCRW
jgi:hypothetical protein